MFSRPDTPATSNAKKAEPNSIPFNFGSKFLKCKFHDPNKANEYYKIEIRINTSGKGSEWDREIS